MKLNQFILLSVVLFLASCGGNGKPAAEVKKNVVLKVAQTEVKGDLKGCYEVVDKDYKVNFATVSYERDFVRVEIKRTSQQLPYDRKDVVIFPEAAESSAANCAGFGIEILDANGDVIDKANAKETPYSWDEVTEALQLLPDETATIQFRFDDLSEAASFRVTSIVEKNEKRGNSVASDVDALFGIAEETVRLSKELSDDIDIKEAQEDAKEALEIAGKAMESAEKMFDALDSMW